MHIWQEFRVLVKTNSLGLRESREIKKDKNQNLTRIFFIGDSFVFGHGIDQNKTIPHLLEQKLNNNNSGKKFEVWNLGVPGYDISRMNRYFNLFTEFNPDIVIIGLNRTDLENELQNDCFKVLENKCLYKYPQCEPKKEKNLFEDLFGWSDTYHFFKEKIPKKYSFQENAKKDLDELVNKIKSINAKPIIVLIPAQEIVKNEQLSEQLTQPIKDYAKENNLPIVDLSPAINKNKKEKQLYFMLVDNHFTEDGAELAAEEITKNFKVLIK